MEAASRLRHERCVRAYDFGGDSGHVYIAYEYVQGSTLRETLRSGKLGDRDAVEASAQILDALAHAHRIGIVHRDVKPSNVLVEVAPTISIRLLDFGLAQFDEADTLTAVGDVPGTLAYIAPERLRGGDATAASDVWAVGVLLWEALVGEHPFWGVPLPQVAAAIEAGAKPIGTARPDVPPAIADAVSSALTIDPCAPSIRRAARRRPANGAHLTEARSLEVGPAAPGDGRSQARCGRDSARAPADPGGTRGGNRHLRRRAPAVLDAGARPAACTRSGRRDDQDAAHRARDRALRADLSARQRRPGGCRRRTPRSRSRGSPSSGATRGRACCSWRGRYSRAVGAIALLPLAVQPARGRVRRALQAFIGVLAAAAVAGVRGEPLPLTGSIVPNLGIDGTTRVTDVIQAVAIVVQDNIGLRRRRSRPRDSLRPCCRMPAGAA